MTRRQLLLAIPAVRVLGQTAQADPWLGDWQSERIVAQIYPLGGRAYRVNLLPEFDQRCPPVAEVDAIHTEGTLRIDSSGWKGEGRDGILNVANAKSEFRLKKTVRLSSTLNAKPPAGAAVLFDGSDLSHWLGINGRGETGECLWKASGGILRGTPVERKPEVMRHIVTKESFPSFRLHVEFRSPLMPEARGQARGNSGVVFENYSYHELQILDSYGLPSYYDDCGSIYKVAAPLVNMCAPPQQWQTYDITYRVSPARITVLQNGKLIHKDFDLPETPAGIKLRWEQPGARTPGRIRLTYHNDAVEFRNIWLVRN